MPQTTMRVDGGTLFLSARNAFFIERRLRAADSKEFREPKEFKVFKERRNSNPLALRQFHNPSVSLREPASLI